MKDSAPSDQKENSPTQLLMSVNHRRGSGTDVMTTSGSDPQAELQERILEHLNKGKESQLYDRTGEQDQLRHTYRQFKENRFNPDLTNFILICGPDGSGKSCLTQKTLRKEVRQDGGYFISGKYDAAAPNQPVEPFRAYVQAMTQFVNQVVKEGDESVALMRESIMNEVGWGGKVLTDIIPTLSQIIGTQCNGGCARGVGAFTRFAFVVQKFLRSISRKKPLILMLENLHFADLCSLDLLVTLVSDVENGCLFVATSCDDEHIADSPIAYLLDRVKRENVNVHTIRLSHLCVNGVNQIAADLLSVPQSKTLPLAEVLTSITKGNTTYVLEAIKGLQQEGMLEYNEDQKGWSWDETVIRSRLCQAELCDFLSHELQQLPQQLKELLKVAACLGFRLNESLLSKALSASVAHYLDMGLEFGVFLIDPLSNEYTFKHESFQKACYKLIPEEERAKFHLAIARRLVKTMRREELEKNIFAVVNQFSKGKHLMKNQIEKYEMAGLCLLAAERAVVGSAFRSAAACMTLGISLLGSKCFREQYDLSIHVHSTAAEVYCAITDFERMEASVQAIFDHGRSLSDKFRAHAIHVYALSSRNRGKEAIKEAMSILNQLGVTFPSRKGMANLMLEFKRVGRILRGKTDETIMRLPEMTDPDKVAAMQILHLMFLDTFINHDDIHPFIPLKMVQLTFENGMCASSSVGFALYSVTHLYLSKNYDEARRYNQLAEKILTKYKAKEFIPRVFCIKYGVLALTRQPIRTILEPLMMAHNVGFETGDIEFGAVNAKLYCFHGFDVMNLNDLRRDCMKFESSMLQRHQDLGLAMIEPFRWTIMALSGTEKNVDIRDRIADVSTRKDMFAIKALFEGLVVAYIQGDIEVAVEVSTRCERALVSNLFASTQTLRSRFYIGMTRAAQAMATSNRSVRALCRKSVREQLRHLRVMARESPQNFCGKFYLLEAEVAAMRGKVQEARQKYFSAVACSQAEGLRADHAVANERAGRFLLAHGDRGEALRYLRNSIEAFGEWGAMPKMESLREEFSEIIDSYGQPRVGMCPLRNEK